MKYGISVPNFGSYGDVRVLAELAREAEAAGWDGFFVWDHVESGGAPGAPMCDPWIALAAVALATKRIRIGPMVTPVPRRRPWKLARETATLDRLSGGRVTLGVGLGFPPAEYSTFGEDADLRVRAAKLDEGLAVLAGLWSGRRFRHEGRHFRVGETTFAPQPVQSPRIPIWVAAMWPNLAPVRRAARWDGVVPIHADITPLSSREVREILACVRAHRTGDGPFDVVLSGESSGDMPHVLQEPLRAYEEAGATWWLEVLTDWRGPLDAMRDQIRGRTRRSSSSPAGDGKESSPSPLRTHPFDPAVLESPFEYYRALRAEAPVFRDPFTGIFHVATYDLVLEALRDFETFGSRFAPAMGAGTLAELAGDPELESLREGSYPGVDTMLTADPPEHERFRGLVNKAFTPRRVDALEPGVAKLADALIDAFVADSRFEVLSQFAVLLPLSVIADQIGVSRADLPRLKRWTDGFTAQLSGMARGEGAKEAVRRIFEFQRYFAARVEEARLSPRDDVLSDLVRARLEGERPLDMPETLSILQQLLVAGNETTASAIAEGLLLLVQNPDELALVRDDPSLLPNLVEEVLRLATPTASMWRKAARDAALGGVEIPAGSMVLLRFASANRDESRFPDPDRFDVRRANAGEHLAFGHGIHFCLGAMLARKEMKVAFAALLDRLDALRLAPGSPEPRHKPSVLLRGLAELHLAFERRAPSR
jgi:cytochrome P450